MLSAVAVAALRLLPIQMARKVARSLPIRHEIEVDGIKILCHPNDNVTERELMLDPQPDNDTCRSVRWILPNLKPGGTFLDVGANCGVYSLFAARKVGSTGRVIAIEPIPTMQERIVFNASRNGFRNIELVRSAAGAEAGTATLYVRGKNYGQSSLIKEPSFTPVSVPVTPLRHVVVSKGLTSIDALKVDVEGFEDRVIIPYLTSSPRSLWPRHIVLKVSSASAWNKDCTVVLKSSGYRLAIEDYGEAMYSLEP